MSLEQGPPPTTIASQNVVAPIASQNVTAPTSQLMAQLQQPLDAKPVNNPSSSVNKNISIPNQTAAKLEQQPQPSPTGNNNKSNINLNHMTQTAPMPATVNPMNPASSVPQQIQQMNSSIMSGMNPSGNGMQQHTTNVSTPSIIQQQLTNNNSNPIQAKQQIPFAPMNAFVDPLEQSLASMEQSQINNNSQKNPSQDMNAMLMDLHKQQMILNSITNAPHIGHVPGSNGFATDFNGANSVNNLMNMLVLPQMDPSSLSFLNSQMKNGPGRFPETWNQMPSTNPMMQQLSVQQQQQYHQMHQHPQINTQQQPSTKQEKIMLTPKPIEELLMNPSDKTKALGGPSSAPGFGQAFNKYEQNLKNASSWSQLAAAGSPQNPGTSITTSSKAKVPSDTFQEYRTKAKEQAQRQKQEQEKMKMKKEQEMKRQQESLQKHKSEDLSNGHRYELSAPLRTINSTPISNYRKQSVDPVSNIIDEMRASPASTSPVSAQTQQERTAAARRAEERAAEQERRRREAVSCHKLFIN